jgi:GNAT superfamily N-acetyltransferase
MTSVITLGEKHVQQVAGVLCEAFADYPVMRFVLGSEDKGYESRLETLMRFFVMARVLRDEIILGIDEGPDLGAAALISIPDGRESPAELGALRTAVWDDLGTEARARYEAIGAACEVFLVDVPHFHLNMIGVSRKFQGRGLGRILMDRIHRLSYEDSLSQGVTLNTEDPANLPLYRHLGYEVIGQSTVAPGLETWGFFRRDPVK